MLSVLAIFSALFVALNADFASQLLELETQKAAWMSNGVTDYVFRQSNSCFCIGCSLVGKYIVIEQKSSTKDGMVTYVEINSQDPLLTQNGGSLDCEVEEPIVDNYRNIENYFNDAISFVQERIDAGCDSGASTDPLIDCGGSVVATYDNTFNYPTSIQINWNSCGAACDAFITYNIGCLTVLNEDITIPSTYTNTCDDFSLSTPTTSTPLCGANEEYDSCGTACPWTNVCGYSGPTMCTLQCVAGCYCQDGYIRKANTGECIPVNQCDTCPPRCTGGFDGCNACGCDGMGSKTFCTKKACFIDDIGPATCGSCEIGYELNTDTNTCDSVKVSCQNQNDCDDGFKCRKDPEGEVYSDYDDGGNYAQPNKVCATPKNVEVACPNGNSDCDTENGFGCLNGDIGEGRCIKYQSV